MKFSYFIGRSPRKLHAFKMRRNFCWMKHPTKICDWRRWGMPNKIIGHISNQQGGNTGFSPWYKLARSLSADWSVPSGWRVCWGGQSPLLDRWSRRLGIKADLWLSALRGTFPSSKTANSNCLLLVINLVEFFQLQTFPSSFVCVLKRVAPFRLLEKPSRCSH